MTTRAKSAVQPCSTAKQGEAPLHFQHQSIRGLQTHPRRKTLREQSQTLQQCRIRLREMHSEPQLARDRSVLRLIHRT